jgi:hypothetical protein
MKKSSPIRLLGFILLYLVGTMGIFSTYYTVHHRTAFQAQVRQEQHPGTLELVFSESDFARIQWIEEQTEFEWNGKLYDVAAIKRVDGNIVIRCENDSLEELLLSLVNPEKEQPGGKLFKGSLQPMTFSAVLIDLSPVLYELTSEHNASIIWSPISYISGTNTPPPKA